MSDYFVYVLKSHRTGRFYTGVSSNPDRRLKAHNLGLNKSTHAGRPWSRRWLSESMPKSEALQLESRIKKRGAKRYLEDISSIG